MIKGLAVKVLGSRERFREEGQKRLKKEKGTERERVKCKNKDKQRR